MQPTKASTVFRELMQTADAELAMFSRRAGLQVSMSAEDLMKARELLESIATALDTGTNRDWEFVRAGWAGLRTKRDPFTVGSSSPVVGPSEPAKPPLIQKFVVAKPALGDFAPGTAGHAEQQKGKFVPVAKPRFVPGGPGAPPLPMAAAPPAAAPFAPPSAPPAAAPYAGPGPQGPAFAPPGYPQGYGVAAPQPAAAAAGPVAPASAWGGAAQPAADPYAAAASPWLAGAPSAAWPGAAAPQPRAQLQAEEWQPPMPPPPPMLAALEPASMDPGIAQGFTRAAPAAGAPGAPSYPAPGMQPPGAYPTSPGGAYAPGTVPQSAPGMPYAGQAGAPALDPHAGRAPGGPTAPPPPPRRRGAAAAAEPEAPGPGGADVADPAAAGSVHNSVAKYAAFCAACAEFPDRLPQTYAGYGVADKAARAEIDAHWQDRFDEDGDLLQKWEQLFQNFRASLRSAR